MGIYSLIVGVWLYLKRTDFYELTPTSFSDWINIPSIFYRWAMLLHWGCCMYYLYGWMDFCNSV
ncbi:hypothetical protein OESDEN_22072 [Oesophagostomum dentatum]|uniref:Uncharacterized protein n=1 Tax=Oesophagostomum dentatum TaxID=61180 RepID=A0A0B1RYY8_OESDE|nr:hypothetical protein OESDEN_22072 [Oesophagostomum dentatum]